MSSDPLVSIVIPVYNGANYVGEAIESALAQTYPNIEVVVVDDGSTDNGATRSVLESFGDRIRTVFKRNGGVATALNAGIQDMRGQLMSWLSHDDLYRPEKVARQVETWRRFGQRCIVIGDFELMHADGKPMQRVSVKGHNLVARPLDAVFRGQINGCALLVPRDLFDEAGLFEPGLPTTQDYELWYRMARLVPFVHCPHADVRQRIHELQGSKLDSHLDEASRMFSNLIDRTPARLMQAYDGSELRFLLRVRKALAPYAGLRTYLTYRIERLLADMAYSVVLWGEGAGVPTSEVAQLHSMRMPPAEIVTMNLDRAGRIAGTVRDPKASADVTVAIPRGTHIGDVVAEARSIKSGIVVFVHAHGSLSERNIRAAIEELITADADVAYAGNAPAMTSELDGVAVRASALSTLTGALHEPGFEWARITPDLQLTSYEMPDPPASVSMESVTEALEGGKRLVYDRALSEAAIGTLLVSMLDENLPTIVFLLHAVGGGAKTHLESLFRALDRKANRLCIQGAANGEFRLSVAAASDGGLVFRLPDQLPDLVRIIRRSAPKRVDVHHVLGFEEQAEAFLDALGVPFDITLVDYHLIANNPFLCLDTGEFVGDDRLRAPEHNLIRRTRHPLLRKASRVIAISRDLAARVNRLSPGLSTVPARLWHDTQVRVRHVFVPRMWEGEPLRVVIAGSIGLHKGHAMVIEVARRIASRKLPIQLHLLGQIDIPAGTPESLGDALTVHGRYETGRFTEMLGALAPHVAWLPSQAPETWSYVLTDFFDAALPVAATAIGAIPERCHGRPSTWLLPWNATAKDWVDLFLRLHASRLEEPPRWASVDELPQAKAIYFEEYLAPARKGA